MTGMRSPRYPGMSLPQAIDLAGKVYTSNRTNPIDREAAAKDMGFAGITGSSTKAMADLIHFGLIEKAGKGGLRITQRTVDILHPESEQGRIVALHEAASSPELFSTLRAHFADGLPSANSLKSYLTRQGFVNTAIPYAVNSYLETSRYLQEQAVTESHGEPDEMPAESMSQDVGVQAARERTPSAPLTVPVARPLHQQVTGDVAVMSGERVIFVDEVSPGRHLRVIASGEVDEELLDALEDFTKRRKKRLARSLAQPNVDVVQGASDPRILQRGEGHDDTFD